MDGSDAAGRVALAVGPDDRVPLPVAGPRFTVALPAFEGPLQLLLHLIESQQLDVLTVPLADVADAYVAHLARHPVDAANLSEFVAIAAQLILLKSRRMLPAEPVASLPTASEEPDEEELRRRIVEYRALRDAALALAARDATAPALRREPRESDLPPARPRPMPASLLVAALERLASTSEPDPPPPELVPRAVTIGEQLEMLRWTLSERGRVVLQAIMAACATRTEAAVTFLATLELVRRRQATAAQAEPFGPIVLERIAEGGE